MSGERSAAKNLNIRHALLLSAAAAVLYAPTLRFGFTNWDDPQYVFQNPLIRSLDAESVRAIFSHFYFANYAPLHLICYALLREIAGVSPWAFHALNVGLHAICAALAYVTLRRLKRVPLWAAWGAAVFLAHPAQVEVVAWVNQTKTLLATGFGMAALLTLLRYREQRLKGSGRWAYASTMVLYACALLSKPQAVAFPGVYFFAERASADGASRLPLTAWIPFAPLALAGAWVGVLAQADIGAVRDYGPLGMLGSILDSVVILANYMRIAFLPIGVSFVHELRPVASPLDPRLGLSALLLLGIAIGAWRARASCARPWHALGWFVSSLLPVLGWIPLLNPFSDRYLYLSILALGWSASGAATHARGAARWVLWAVPILFAVLSLQRMPAWKDADAMWETAVREHPESYRSWTGRGGHRMDLDDKEGAEADFRKAVQLNPGEPEVWTNLGIILKLQGKVNEANHVWQKAIEMKPTGAWPRLYLARSLASQGRNREALALADSVVRERPNFAMAYGYRGSIHEDAGDPKFAEADHDRAVSLDPFLADSYLALGRLRANRGDLAGAREAYRKFLRVWTSDPVEADRVRRRLEALSSQTSDRRGGDDPGHELRDGPAQDHLRPRLQPPGRRGQGHPHGVPTPVPSTALHAG